MHDNAKLEKAVAKWLKKNCIEGFGQVYSRALMADFEEFLRKTKLLQASPGITAFGIELNRLGFGRKRVNGLQYVTGLELKEIRQVKPARQARSQVRANKSEVERKQRVKKVKASVNSKIKRTTAVDEVDKRMKAESKKHNQSAANLK
jgi:hypothetical protein